MKQVLIALVTFAILASCSSTSRLARLLERHPLPEKRDTIVIPGETIYIDTTIFKYIPGEVAVESLYIDVPISIPDTFIEAFTSTAKAIAWLQDNELGLQLIQYDTLFQFMLDSAIREHTPDTVKVLVEKSVPEYIEPNPFWKNGFLVLAGLIVIGLILRFVFRK